MISIVRFLLLARLWTIPLAVSSEGLLRGRGEEDKAPPWGNSTDTRHLADTAEVDYHHQASHMTPRIIGGDKVCINSPWREMN